MTAKTDEEKAADKAAKEQEAATADEQKRNEKAAEEDAQRSSDAAASVSAAAAQSEAEAEVRERLRNELKEEIAKEAQEGSSDDKFEGQVIHGDNFSIVTKGGVGRNVVEIIPAGWVGPGFEIAPVRVKELAELLGKVKNLPKE